VREKLQGQLARSELNLQYPGSLRTSSQYFNDRQPCLFTVSARKEPKTFYERMNSLKVYKSNDTKSFPSYIKYGILLQLPLQFANP
jgi:hypothetical protein